MTQSTHDRHLARARTIATALDSAIGIPGTKFRFGLDPILGLVPGLGDFVAAGLSGYIVLIGIRAGAPQAAVTRMIANVAIDTLVGSVPVVGDLFDAGWKSNLKNLELIERHVGIDAPPRAPNKLLFVGGVLALLLIALAGIALAIMVVRAVLGFF